MLILDIDDTSHPWVELTEVSELSCFCESKGELLSCFHGFRIEEHRFTTMSSGVNVLIIIRPCYCVSDANCYIWWIEVQIVIRESRTQRLTYEKLLRLRRLNRRLNGGCLSCRPYHHESHNYCDNCNSRD